MDNQDGVVQFTVTKEGFSQEASRPLFVVLHALTLLHHPGLGVLTHSYHSNFEKVSVEGAGSFRTVNTYNNKDFDTAVKTALRLALLTAAEEMEIKFWGYRLDAVSKRREWDPDEVDTNAMQPHMQLQCTYTMMLLRDTEVSAFCGTAETAGTCAKDQLEAKDIRRQDPAQLTTAMEAELKFWRDQLEEAEEQLETRNTAFYYYFNKNCMLTQGQVTVMF